MSRRLVVLVGMLSIVFVVMAMCGPSKAFAVQYSFSRVYTGTLFVPYYNPPNPDGPLSAAAINDNGLVAVVDGASLVTTNGHTTTIIAGPGAQNLLNQQDRQVLSMNSSGFVAFRGYASDGTYGILASDGPTTRKIAADSSNGGAFTDIQNYAISINDNGMVAFSGKRSSNFGQSAYIGDGTAIPTLAVSGPANFPSINNSGAIAYGYGFGVKILRESQTYTLPGMFPGAPDINGSGTAAYWVNLDSVQTIVVGDGISPTMYLDLSYYAGISNGYSIDGVAPVVAINDQELVAFLASVTVVQGLPQPGIYTGANPATDKVIAYGDALDGATVTQLYFGRGGLNNNGQIAFTAELSDGTQGVFVATPIPEPSTIALLLAGATSLLAFVWRKRRAA
jgi:hypothetical protein